MGDMEAVGMVWEALDKLNVEGHFFRKAGNESFMGLYNLLWPPLTKVAPYILSRRQIPKKSFCGTPHCTNIN